MALNTESIEIKETPLDSKDGEGVRKKKKPILNFEPTTKSFLGKLASLETHGSVCKVGTSILLVIITKLIVVYIRICIHTHKYIYIHIYAYTYIYICYI